MASERLQAVFNAVETVSESLDDITESIQRQKQSLGSLSRDYLENTAVTKVAEQSQASLAREVNDVSRALGEASRAFTGYMGASSGATASTAAMAGSAGVLRNRMDSAEEEIDEATRSLALYQAMANSSALSMGHLSVNVGAFTIALRDLHTQIPILVTTLGSLISVAGGAATAMTTAVAAMSAFAVGGAVAFLEDVEEEMEGVTSQAEALEAVMLGLRDTFIDALEPLMTAENVDFFINAIEWFARLINRSAQFFQQIRPMIIGFMDNLSEATDDVDNLFTGLARGFDIAEPALVNFFAWINNNLPDAIIFMSQTVIELQEPLSNLADAFIDMTIALVEMAEGALPAVVSVVDILLGAIESLADIFNFLGDGLTQIIFTFGVAALVSWNLAGAFDGLSRMAMAAATDFTAVQTSATGLTGALIRLRVVTTDMLAKRFPNLTKAIFGTEESVSALRKSLISILPTISTFNGAVQDPDTGNFISPHDISNVKLLRTQLGATTSRLKDYILSTRAGEAAIASFTATQGAMRAMMASLLPAIDVFSGSMQDIASGQFISPKDVSMFAMLKKQILATTVGMKLYTAATGIATAAMAAFNAMTGGIPLLIGAIITAGAVLVGVLGNLGGITSAVGASFSTLQNILVGLADAMLSILVPVWNNLVGVFEIILAPIMGIIRGISALLGVFSSGEGEGGGFISMLLSGFGAVADVVGQLLSVVNPILAIIADAVESFFFVPLMAVAELIKMIIGIVMSLVNSFMEIGIVKDIIAELVGWFQELGKVIDMIIGGAIDIINNLIDTANLIPGVNIEKLDGETTQGARTSAKQVKENLDRESEESDEDIQTEANVEMNFEDNVEQNVDVDADPEEREQLRRIVKDAINEANSLQRRREGHPG